MNRLKYREKIEDYIRPLDGFRGKLEAQGKEVKNHIKQNRLALKGEEEKFKQKQNSVRSQNASMANTASDQFKMKRF